MQQQSRVSAESYYGTLSNMCNVTLRLSLQLLYPMPQSSLFSHKNEWKWSEHPLQSLRQAVKCNHTNMVFQTTGSCRWAGQPCSNCETIYIAYGRVLCCTWKALRWHEQQDLQRWILLAWNSSLRSYNWSVDMATLNNQSFIFWNRMVKRLILLIIMCCAQAKDGEKYHDIASCKFPLRTM